MSAMILHHYWPSLVAEKVRKVLGIKNASWRSEEILRRCCQTNANSSQFASSKGRLCSTKLLPLIKCSAALKFKLVSAV